MAPGYYALSQNIARKHPRESLLDKIFHRKGNIFSFSRFSKDGQSCIKTWPPYPNKLCLNLSRAVGAWGGAGLSCSWKAFKCFAIWGKWQWRSLSCRNFPPHGLYDGAQPTLPLALVGEKCHSEHFRPLSHISEIELACCNPTLNNTIIIIIIILLLSYICKGRVRLLYRMNFWKNSKRPLNPPPHFWKIILQFFIMDMVACKEA